MHHGGWVGGLLGIKPGSHRYETRVVITGHDNGPAIFPVWFFKAFPKKNTLLVFPVYPLTPQYGKLWPLSHGEEWLSAHCFSAQRTACCTLYQCILIIVKVGFHVEICCNF